MPTICLIPGDGVGKEVVPAAARVLAATEPALRFVEAEAGWECFERHGTALPEATRAVVASADATLFGATQSPMQIVSGYKSPILTLRRELDLYANLRPVVTLLPGQPAVDLLIVRENTEGLYSGSEHREGDTAIAERIITRRASERIAHVACKQARARKAARGDTSKTRRPVVTIVHKANVLKLSDGLFRESCLAVAAQYPDIQVEEMLVDSAAMWLVKDPGHFNVMVTTNLFGDILSDLAAGLVGGLGVAPSANLGSGQPAVFEPVHGSAPDIAGRGIANPVGTLLSSAMLMQHLGQVASGQMIHRAVVAALARGIRTPDLGGTATTEQFIEQVLHYIQVARERNALDAQHA